MLAWSLLVAIGTNLGCGTTPTITDSLGTHLTWTLGASFTNAFGQAMIWTAPCPSAQTGMTVTLSGNSSQQQAIKVVVLTGADASQAGPASATNGGHSGTVTPARANSLIFTASFNWTTGFAQPSPLSGNTMTINGDLCFAADGTSGAVYDTMTTSTSLAAGASVTVGTNSAAGNSGFAALEVLAPIVTPALAGVGALPRDDRGAALQLAGGIADEASGLAQVPVLVGRGPAEGQVGVPVDVRLDHWEEVVAPARPEAVLLHDVCARHVNLVPLDNRTGLAIAGPGEG